MSGIDSINEGGDFIIENGVRTKVGFTTDELSQNPALAVALPAEEPEPVIPAEPIINEKPDTKKKGALNGD